VRAAHRQDQRGGRLRFVVEEVNMRRGHFLELTIIVILSSSWRYSSWG
jgi:hypothetical protein